MGGNNLHSGGDRISVLDILLTSDFHATLTGDIASCQTDGIIKIRRRAVLLV
jgi:hypothetical protein